ncbi:hypothetical protein CFP56_020326 [Quercus suber]|uniref:Uncharacterized protein n=1 Tax=Quercus suber TaxID=58331 RepID=A0AAW0KGV8_QUESU
MNMLKANSLRSLSLTLLRQSAINNTTTTTNALRPFSSLILKQTQLSNPSSKPIPFPQSPFSSSSTVPVRFLRTGRDQGSRLWTLSWPLMVLRIPYSR